MEKIPFHMGISILVNLIVIFFLKNSIFYGLGCRLMKIFCSMDLVVVTWNVLILQTWLSSCRSL